MTRSKKVVLKRLGEVLISRGLITDSQLAEALDIQKKDGRRIGEILVDLKYITEEAVAWALTVIYGYPYLKLANYKIDKDIVKLVPESISNKYQILAIDRVGNVLTIVVTGPLNQETIEEIEKDIKYKVEIFITTMSEFKNTISNFYK
jgi:type IV pilus assembly protein PilB